VKDLAGRDLLVGDVVTDSRGKLFQIRETPASVQAQRIAYAYEGRWARGGFATAPKATAVRLYNALRVSGQPPATQAEYAAQYKAGWDQHQQPVARGEIEGHKARVKAAGLQGGATVAPVPEKAGYYTAATWERIVPDYKRSVWRNTTYAISFDGKVVRHYMECNLQRHLATVQTKGWTEVKVRSKHKDTRSMIAAMDRWAVKHGFRSVIK
jgi:hypothetical protein